jgi:hypothetical protein
MTIASIPKSNDIQEPSSTVKPVTSPNDTNSNNDDDEVRIERRNHNAQTNECFVVSLHFRFLTGGHECASYIRRFSLHECLAISYSPAVYRK